MASVTPAAGETGFQPACPGGSSNYNGQPFRTQGAPSQQAEAPRIERLGPVRILRGSAGWRGIALRLISSEGEDARFQLALTAGDGRSVTVAVLGEDEAVATWRDFGRSSGLPLLLESTDGVITEPFPQLGRLALGPVRIRRRYALLAGRRPRFLTRRKTGRFTERPVVIQGEILSG
ncbi:DUF6101 family protein [Bosea sp. WAO]|uniref:DUF6101 family protein n=1 Tax=Bosea sp. WAO TaxID=406341 RepID=UPI000829D5D1|nr:DUF6101 family protein [Bosea sp. WAO]